MSEYTQQAENFLKKHNLKFRTTYKKYGPYFAGEAVSRSIYTCTISGKGRGRYTCSFGASVNMTMNNEEPTAYDLLTSITKSDPYTFEDFCSEYGYDEDSRAAEKVYKAVVKDWAKVERFFTLEEIEEMQEIS